MDWQVEFDMAVRVVVSAILGGVIGWERQLEGRAAGILTYAAVSLGSCCFGLISTYAAGEHDPGRIAAQVVSGIGFLGAGVILRERGQVKGLTHRCDLVGNRIRWYGRLIRYVYPRSPQLHDPLRSALDGSIEGRCR